MDTADEIALRKFYQKLYDNLIRRKKKIVNDSILITFLKLTSNNRFRLLTESTLPAYKLDKTILKELVTKKLIRGTDRLSHFVITAKGIWEVESKNGSINNNKLLEFLDNWLFNYYHDSEKPLSEKEKVVLFAMIAARAFSKDSAVNLRKSETIKDKWGELLNKSLEKLRALGIISKLEGNELFKKQGNEHPVSGLFRRTNNLTKKIKGIYKSPGGKILGSIYYLDISIGGDLSKDKLKYLFKRVLGSVDLTPTKMNELDNFCRDTAHKENIYLFDTNTHLFSKPKYDKIIRDILLRYKNK